MNQAFPSPVPLDIYHLGTVELDDVLDLQRRLIYQLGDSGASSLIICEHPPTITVGRSGSRAFILPDDDQLERWGIQVRWVNRGGGGLVHLPGQLNAYVIHDLKRAGLSVQDYLNHLHQTILSVLVPYDLRGRLRADRPGIYLDEARVSSVGVAIKRWIAYYGVSLNVSPYLSAMDALLAEPEDPLVPFGPKLRLTSMLARRQRPTSIQSVQTSLIDRLEQQLGLSRRHVHTSHPSIRRKVRPHVLAPSYG